MRIGFIGLGTMGGPMALNVQAAGHQLAVHDLRRDAAAPHIKNGATWAASARDAGAGADIVFTSLPGPREVEAVADGLIETMRAGTTWFDLSTNSPTVVRKLHARLAAKSIAHARCAGERRTGRREIGQARAVGRRRARALRPSPCSARRDRRPGALHRRHRRRLGRQARAQLRGLHDPGRACRSVHARRQGRRAAARSVGGGAAGIARAHPHLRPARQAIFAGRVRSRRFRAQACAQGRDACDGASDANSACRCAWPTSRMRK